MMIERHEAIPDSPFEPRWIICESSDRWSRAVRRFLHQIAPGVEVSCVVTETAAEVMAILQAPGPLVILWEFGGQSLVHGCESLIQTATISPKSLQLVASYGISEREKATLSELPVATFVTHPEDLPRLRPMIQGYFARYRQLLD